MAWLDLLLHGDPGGSPSLATVILSLLLGFVIGQVIGWVYQATHTSPSYSDHRYVRFAISSHKPDTAMSRNLRKARRQCS